MSFVSTLKGIINTGQSRSVILTGNVYDLFFDGTNYVPLMPYLSSSCKADATPERRGITQVMFELNRPVFLSGSDAGIAELHQNWKVFSGTELKDRLEQSNSNATFALELLRQMAVCNRSTRSIKNNLLFLIEAADMLVPECEISRMSVSDRKRVVIIQDWLSDPKFMSAGDSVVLISESRSAIHSRISRLPNVLSIDIPLPNLETRLHFIEWFIAQRGTNFDKTPQVIAEETSGLSIHAIRQLLLSGNLSPANVNQKVEEYMVSQLGEGVVEYLRPTHKLGDIVGFKRVKEFSKTDLIPGFLNGTISGAAVGGPIGGGKTYLCEAIASELGIPVIILKGIRSQWFGETDKIIERLRRLLESFHKVVIFVDEADTQFGNITDGHETERRLTGKIQAMMSDVRLKGRVIWFLMTARIHLLSADIRRPGRMDLIIPILDPEGDDRREFINWTLGDLKPEDGSDPSNRERVWNLMKDYSAATFAALRSQIKQKKCQTLDEALKVAEDILQPDIESVRQYQTLQAKLNCTRKSLLFDPHTTPSQIQSERDGWRKELARLEQQGHQ